MRLLHHGVADRPRLTVLSLITGCVLMASTACAAPTASPAAPQTGAPTPAPVDTPSPTATARRGDQLPQPDHVVIVILENKDVDQVLGNGDAPFLNGLAHTGVDFTNAHAEVHPSHRTTSPCSRAAPRA